MKDINIGDYVLIKPYSIVGRVLHIKGNVQWVHAQLAPRLSEEIICMDEITVIYDHPQKKKRTTKSFRGSDIKDLTLITKKVALALYMGA